MDKQKIVDYIDMNEEVYVALIEEMIDFYMVAENRLCDMKDWILFYHDKTAEEVLYDIAWGNFDFRHKYLYYDRNGLNSFNGSKAQYYKEYVEAEDLFEKLNELGDYLECIDKELFDMFQEYKDKEKK